MAVIAFVMNGSLSIFGKIITYPSALPKDRCLIRVVEAELMHSSQGEHHPWGAEVDPSSLAQPSPAGVCPCRRAHVHMYVFFAIQLVGSVSVLSWEDSVRLRVGMHT